MSYRGRLAPSPTGYLHLGHARTFWTAQERARGGTLVLRIEDLDRDRSRPEFEAAILEDLTWFGFTWQERPYRQSERIDVYRQAFERLKQIGVVFPCTCSRKDVLRALQAPHVGEEEPVYPGTCRTRATPASTCNWRFRVPDGEAITFIDRHFGSQTFVAGTDFGDFIVWRHDDLPSYQLAVVVDDAAMQITEVVRGADLLLSTARQLLLYRAFEITPPAFYHCPLMHDEAGVRLAKRHDALSLRALRSRGVQPEVLRSSFGAQA